MYRIRRALANPGWSRSELEVPPIIEFRRFGSHRPSRGKPKATATSLAQAALLQDGGQPSNDEEDARHAPGRDRRMLAVSGPSSGGSTATRRREIQVDQLGQRVQAFCERFGLRLPILLAPMAGACPPSLSIAVMKAGGAGACGALLMTPDDIRAWVAEVRGHAEG